MIKTFLTSLLFFITIYSSWGQTEGIVIRKDLYPYKSQYFNLDDFKFVNLKTIPHKTFKTDSKYAYRFSGLSVDKLAFKGQLFSITKNNGMSMRNLSTEASIIFPNKEAEVERFGQNFMVSVEDGVVYVKHLNAENGYMLYKYNTAGEEVFGIKLAHSKFIQSGKLEYYRPFLRYFTHSRWAMVFTSYDPTIEKTHVIDAIKGEVNTFDFRACGVIRDTENDAEIIGFTRINKETGELVINYKSKEFSVKVDHITKSNTIETLVKDNLLIVADFHGMKTGAHLYAIHLNKEKIQWKGATKQLKPTDTSSYYNTIWLSLYKNKLVLEGSEKGGAYLQIFDVDTGERLHTEGL